MRGGGARLPWAARALIACVGCVALVCAAPAAAGMAGFPELVGSPSQEPDGHVLLPLAALYAASEYAPRCRVLGPRVPGNLSAFFPILLTGAFLLPPAAAALVPLPGALIGRVERRHAPARRIWHAEQLALAAFAAATVREWLSGGPVGSGGGAPGHGGGGSLHSGTDAALFSSGFPLALISAGLAALAFCAVVAVLDGAVLIAAERCAPRAAWRGQLPRVAAPSITHGFVGLVMAMLWRSAYGPLAALFVLLPMYISCWAYALYDRERGAHQSTIRALVQAVDIKDRYTRGHSERVGRASALIARELGMDDERTEALRFAGILHDIGKLGVPTRLLRKDGPLTPEERRVIQLHPEYGHEMVRGIGFLGEARSAILHHHERLDGSGYPCGLSGEQIPEFARIVAVADAFDAMTSTRSYRRARPVPTAVAELQRCAGTQFDPRMVRALARALDRQGWSPAATTDGPEGPGASGNVTPRSVTPGADASGADASGSGAPEGDTPECPATGGRTPHGRTLTSRTPQGRSPTSRAPQGRTADVAATSSQTAGLEAVGPSTADARRPDARSSGPLP
jgi:putative nucleotidyltransferase with HDIG domain